MTTQEARELFAKDINAELEGISRKLDTPYELDFEVGQVITSEKAESWTDGGEFDEGSDEFVYVLKAVNEFPVHIVDYDNEEEVYELSAVEGEKEVLVAIGTSYKVIEVGNVEDMQEVGFITVEVEYVGGIN